MTAAQEHALTVITVTRGRPASLRRAIDTVVKQDYAFSIEHLIVVDDDEDAYRPVHDEAATSPGRTLRWHFASRLAGEKSGSPVLGRLRNMAARMAETDLIAYLDDDNLLEPHHYSSLLRCMRRTGCTAVHSQRRLWRQDGSLFLTRLSPWKRDIVAAERRYAELRRHEVYVPWSNVIRDQVHPLGAPDRVQMVDTSEWLFARAQVLDTPFGEQFTEADRLSMTGEDNKLLAAIVDQRVPVAGTHLPTLIYRLGGFSNAFDQPAEGESWASV